MAPHVQHYYCHGCNEYIEAMADDNEGYDSDSDEEWEEVMEECPNCGSPFFELLDSEANEHDMMSGNPSAAGQPNANNNYNYNNNTSNINMSNIAFPPDMPEQIRNMITSAINQGGTPHQMMISIDLTGGEFSPERDNGLPASCKDFTVEDVLNILNSYPDGVPREGTRIRPSNGEQQQEKKEECEKKESLEDNEVEQNLEQATPTTPTPIPNDGVCTVCLESVYAPCSSEVVQMHCTHCYHRNCLKSWFEKGVFTCPTCRQPAIKGDI